MNHLKKYNEMAIEIVPKKTNKTKSTPFYTLTYDYMIGDANGDTSEEVQLSADNPYIERYCKLLNSLKSTKGTWGITLNRNDIYKHFQEKQITQDDYDFLMATMFEGENDDYFKPENDIEKNTVEKYACEFWEGVRAEAEYSFLVFQGVSLTYTDEYGEEHKTRFT